MENRVIRCMFAGPSGIGKTTLAKYVSEIKGIPFISGSYSDLVPSTRDKTHEEMVDLSKESIYQGEHNLLFARHRAFSRYAQNQNNPSFVTDRSYIDSLAYFVIKLAKSMPYCETESFEGLVRHFFYKECTHLIVMSCTEEMVDTWKVEDNKKRILNPYFQWMVSNIILASLQKMGFKRSFFQCFNKIIHPDGIIKVLILESRDIDKNKELISKFLK